MKLLQLKTVSGYDSEVWIAVCGGDFCGPSRWHFPVVGEGNGADPVIRVGAFPITSQFFCTVTECISSLRFIENATLLAKTCITVFALNGETLRKIQTVLRHCRRTFRISCQGLFRKERRLRL